MAGMRRNSRYDFPALTRSLSNSSIGKKFFGLSMFHPVVIGEEYTGRDAYCQNISLVFASFALKSLYLKVRQGNQ
jgi:hypothetical protein